jgi:DNA-binding MarR family transcriptional regulator
VKARPARPEAAVEDAFKCIARTLNIFDPMRFLVWSEIGITTTQLRVMFLIREMPGVTAGELAAQLRVTPPTVSGIVDRLVRLGLVRREEDPSDRRLVRNHLTEDGANACSRLQRGGESYLRRILEEMDNRDFEELRTSLHALLAAAERVSREDPDLAHRVMDSAE